MNKYQQALNFLYNTIKDNLISFDDTEKEAVEILQELVDKATPTKPSYWGDGYDNVTICVTCENQSTADYRLPIFISLPIKHKEIIHEPMLENINIEKYLASGQIDKVICGGESGDKARVCNYDWILNTRSQCLKYNVSFHFKQTGANFMKDNKVYKIPRKYQLVQASKSRIDISS